MSRESLPRRKSRSQQKKIAKKRNLHLEMLEPRALLNGTSLFSEHSNLWNLTASNFQTVGKIAAPVNSAPTIATAAAASKPTTTTVQLSVKGADNAGETALRYTWAVTTRPAGADSPIFSVNGTNAAKNCLATFKAAGSYVFTVTVTDAGNLTTTSRVSVTVNQSLSKISVTPATTTVVAGGKQQFSAVGLDQFGKTMTSQPTFNWTASTGSISSTGLYTAPSAFGTATITASSGALKGTAAVAISNRAPTVTTAVAVTNGITGKTVQLYALGADDGGETNLRYTWAAVSLPTGATAPTFSANGTNAAKNTQVTFNTAGVYNFTVTIADAGNLSVTSAKIVVQVNQTLTSVSLTPSTPTIIAGVSQQFTATGLDQFGKAMAVQPTFTWSTSTGTLTSSGLFTCLSTGSVTVMAQTGSLNATTTVTIVSSSTFLGMKDAALAALTQSLFVDGSISRADIIQLLTSTIADGTVNSNEFADLKTIVSSAATLKMADYVKVLASDVVNGNAANAHYQGGTLGNLAAGSTSTTMNKLIQKWFYGADHPTLCNSSLVYTAAAGSLFDHTPTHTDEYQGMLGDCYFISALGTLADSNPQAVRNMFIDNGDGTFTVRFYTGNYGTIYNYSDGSIGAGFKDNNITADYVTVDRMLVTSTSGMFAYANYGGYASNTANTLWIALAEKAYAQWNETGLAGRDGTNAFASIQGGWMATVDAQVLGYNATDYIMTTTSQSVAVNALAAHKAVTIGTLSWSGTNAGLYANHAYAIVGYNASTNKFTLYNPWGSNQPGDLSWSQLQSLCSQLAIADTSGTKIISGAPAVSVSVKSSFAEPIVPFAAASVWQSFAPTSLTQNMPVGSDSILNQAVKTDLTVRPTLAARDTLFASGTLAENRLAVGSSYWSTARSRFGGDHHADSSLQAMENLLQEENSDKPEDIFSENYCMLNVDTSFVVI